MYMISLNVIKLYFTIYNCTGNLKSPDCVLLEHSYTVYSFMKYVDHQSMKDKKRTDGNGHLRTGQ